MITLSDLSEKVPQLLEWLKPCPFCGSEKLGFSYKRKPYITPTEYSVRFRCLSCHCGTGKSTNPEQLIPLWNGAKR
jgi:hypothetical protein